MIPTVIHYCWFGRGKKPKLAEKCIASWKKYCPDYEIIEWNEDNFDITKIPYIYEAYQVGKFAFVSDYARFDILYQHGGVYLDTDVEIVRPLDPILNKGAFMGCEIDPSPDVRIQVASGLGIAAEAGMEIYRKILDAYATRHFVLENGEYDSTTVVTFITDILLENGLKSVPGIQRVSGITVYPAEYFNPFNDITGKISKTRNTYAIHWYAKSWLSSSESLRARIARPFHRVFGEDCFAWLKKEKKK